MSRPDGLASFLLSVEELENLPDLKWLVDGWIPKPSLTILYGEPGGGKTFAALDLALTVASGSEWMGRKVKNTSVLYIAAEGVLGLKNRVKGYRSKAPIEEDRICFLGTAIDIRDTGQIGELMTALEQKDFAPGLIIVDTLARVSTGADENSAKDMGMVVEGLDRLKHTFDASVIAIHHTGKIGKSERGSSALRGAADVMIKCSPTSTLGGKAIRVECDKMKDTEPFKSVEVDLKQLKLENGASSLVLGDFREGSSTIGSMHAGAPAFQ